MKLLLLFLVFFLAGFTLVSGFSYIQKQHLPSIAVSTTGVTTKFSLANAPIESLKGNVASASGTVQWLSRIATKQVKIYAPHTIQQGESLSTGKNSMAIVTIKKDALISIFPNTDVNFIQLLPINFVLEQNDGSVMYQNTIETPISVRSFDLVTAITNGAVTISADKKGKTVTVTVQKGVVNEGFEDAQNNSNVITVTVGEQFIFDDMTREGTVTELPGFVSNNSLPFDH